MLHFIKLETYKRKSQVSDLHQLNPVHTFRPQFRSHPPMYDYVSKDVSDFKILLLSAGIFWLAERLLASQERFHGVSLVAYVLKTFRIK
jgi:hypothetical protein